MENNSFIKPIIENINQKTVVYPGSFDPITLGHMDIIERAAKMFDKVIIAVGVNQSKKCIFSVDERMNLVRIACKNIKNIEVDSFDGLIANYINTKNAIGVVKGLRAVSDFDYEFQMSLTNRSLNEAFETILLPSRLDFMYLSSSVVRQVGMLNGDITKYIPKDIIDTVKNKLNT